jgi:hypothetical protein
LRDKVSNRRITPEQHDKLVGTLKNNPSEFDLAHMGDPESILYSNDIIKTLTDAGWRLGQKEMPLDQHWTGLTILSSDDVSSGVLLVAFLNAQIEIFKGNPEFPRKKATIMVGSKPAKF